MAGVVEFPKRDTFTRWAERFPYQNAQDPDPREGPVCMACGQTFAWYGYEGLCGWCFEEQA